MEMYEDHVDLVLITDRHPSFECDVRSNYPNAHEGEILENRLTNLEKYKKLFICHLSSLSYRRISYVYAANM